MDSSNIVCDAIIATVVGTAVEEVYGKEWGAAEKIVSLVSWTVYPSRRGKVTRSLNPINMGLKLSNQNDLLPPSWNFL